MTKTQHILGKLCIYLGILNTLAFFGLGYWGIFGDYEFINSTVVPYAVMVIVHGIIAIAANDNAIEYLGEVVKEEERNDANS